VIQGKEVLYVGEALTGGQAESYAKALGGVLVTVENAIQNQAVKDILSHHGSTEAWIGLNDVRTEGVWEWFSGADNSFRSWFGGEPNNRRNEDYVTIFNENGNWNDRSGADRKYPFFVERSQPNKPLQPPGSAGG